MAVTFHLAVPKVFETHRVRGDQDDVLEIELGMTFTRRGLERRRQDALGVDLIHGGELRDREMKARSRVGVTLCPPSQLSRRVEHEYASG